MSYEVCTSWKVSARPGSNAPYPTAASNADASTGAQPRPFAPSSAPRTDRARAADATARDTVRTAESLGEGDGMLPGLGLEAGPDPSVLVLGSFPSVIARRERAYYANPQNHFWPIMEAAPRHPADAAVPGAGRRPERARGRALGHGRRLPPGGVHGPHDPRPGARRRRGLARGPSLRAARGGQRPHGRAVSETRPPRARRRADRPDRVLPSTSPANAGTRFEEKLRLWSVVRDHARLTRSSRS